MKTPRPFRKRKTGTAAAPVVQLRETQAHPFEMLAGRHLTGPSEIALYRALREAVPLLDAALLKIIRLAGGFFAVCPDKKEAEALNDFLLTVPAGRGQVGAQAFLDAYLDSLLTCGQAVGEIVLGAETGRIEALLCGDAGTIGMIETDNPLHVCIGLRKSGGTVHPLPRQDLLLFTPYNPQPQHPYGVSLLRGMPFLADILLKIYQSIGLNWERVGNTRFAVVCKPSDIGALASDQAAQIAAEWSAAMQSGPSGRVRDFVAVGDVDIRVIGADNQILDSQIPVRQILEQLIARTGIPPFLLGLNWSSTERMSSQQADILTSEIAALRRTVTPTLVKAFRLWQTLQGRTPNARVEWEVVNLQDEVEEARAHLMRAQAEKLQTPDV